mmetsp:Transcript_3329/g.7322  ORF Transcript_3329/g.7322 Transcript_3329/m.7322 type:complete len:88 (-) Transcript_3329:1120-1383(-)
MPLWNSSSHLLTIRGSSNNRLLRYSVWKQVEVPAMMTTMLEESVIHWKLNKASYVGLINAPLSMLLLFYRTGLLDREVTVALVGEPS